MPVFYFLYMASRKFKIAYVVHILFLLVKNTLHLPSITINNFFLVILIFLIFFTRCFYICVIVKPPINTCCPIILKLACEIDEAQVNYSFLGVLDFCEFTVMGFYLLYMIIFMCFVSVQAFVTTSLQTLGNIALFHFMLFKGLDT